MAEVGGRVNFQELRESDTEEHGIGGNRKSLC